MRVSVDIGNWKNFGIFNVNIPVMQVIQSLEKDEVEITITATDSFINNLTRNTNFHASLFYKAAKIALFGLRKVYARYDEGTQNLL